jgi:dephospho-CoA kinase
MWKKPIVIGLTGGIGSGKTFVAKLFKEFGAKIIDADKIAHKIINHPSVSHSLLKWYDNPVHPPDADKEGPIKDGQINRRSIARLSFANTDNIKRLNRLTHPFIKKEIYRQFNRLRKLNEEQIIIIDAPLLLETNLDKLCDYILFINTPYKLRLERLADSRKWTYQEMRKREKYQMAIRKKQALSNFVINNNLSAQKTREQVKILLQRIYYNPTNSPLGRREGTKVR